MRAFGWSIGLVGLVACGGTAGVVDDKTATDTGATDGDSDTDADADADADSDADADTDTVPTTGAELLFDANHVLVVPDGNGLQLIANDGSTAFSATWNQLVGSCNLCGGEGASADGDGLLLAFTTIGPTGPGAIARINASGGMDFRVDGFDFPHDAVRDPADDTILIPEATSNKITWIAGDGSSSKAVRTLDSKVNGWPGDTPNGVSRLDLDGKTYLLSSHRMGGGGGPGFGSPSGEITMWDITTAGAPKLLWSFPADGALNTPHGCIYRQYQGRWWMIYAHSDGGQDGSSVGLAVTDDPAVRPEYVADLVPTGNIAPFVFLRGVELTSDGFLYLTDSGTTGGPGGGNAGRVIKADMPTLLPTGASGAAGADQVFVDLENASVLADGFENPFEGWLWVPTFPL